MMVNQITPQANFETLQETHDLVQIRIATYQKKAARYYNKKAKNKVSLPSDLVCKKLEAVEAREGQGKFTPKWEDPTKVKEDIDNGAYRLETLDG